MATPKAIGVMWQFKNKTIIQMKKIVIALLVILLAGCERENKFFEPEEIPDGYFNLDLKKAEISKQHKGWFTTQADFSKPFTICAPAEYGVELPGSGWMEGHETHGGKLVTELSTWTITSCYLGPGPSELTEIVEGKHTLARGDYYVYHGSITVDSTNGHLEGEIFITSGTGMYENVTGYVKLDGLQNFKTLQATFTAVGYMNFSK
jgi:hypothetical protein